MACIEMPQAVLSAHCHYTRTRVRVIMVSACFLLLAVSSSTQLLTYQLPAFFFLFVGVDPVTGTAHAPSITKTRLYKFTTASVEAFSPQLYGIHGMREPKMSFAFSISLSLSQHQPSQLMAICCPYAGSVGTAGFVADGTGPDPQAFALQ